MLSKGLCDDIFPHVGHFYRKLCKETQLNVGSVSLAQSQGKDTLLCVYMIYYKQKWIFTKKLNIYEQRGLINSRQNTEHKLYTLLFPNPSPTDDSARARSLLEK